MRTIDVECPKCEGYGGTDVEYCCEGFDHEGVQVCGCAGSGNVVRNCEVCDGTGHIIDEGIIWDFNSLDDAESHEYQVHYSISGKGAKSGLEYIGTAIYTCGKFDTIAESELA
jgi:DnaJ-class molecular chaperone